MTVRNDNLRQDRDRLLANLMAILEDDDRVRAVWLSGSFGRGTEDDWSDLDMHVTVVDDHFDAWLDERHDLYHRIGIPVLIRPDKPSNAGDGPYQGVLFEGPVFLDFNIHPASTARPGVDCRILFDRLPLPPDEPPPLTAEERAVRIEEAVDLFWKMTPIALKYVARGRTDLAMIQLSLLLGAYVTVWRSIHAPDRLEAGGAHWLHPVHDADLQARLPRLGATIDPPAVLEAITRLMDEVDALQASCAGFEIAPSREAAGAIRRFRDSIAADMDITKRGPA